VRAAALVLCDFLAPGCFRVEVYAPHGPPVKLLPRDEQTSVMRIRRTWYSVLGAAAMDGTMPAHIMDLEDFTEVRVRVTDTIPDAFIGIFNTALLQVGVLAQTYEVLGNRAAAAAEGAPAPVGAADPPAR